MAKLLKLRRGTTTQHSSFTGAEGEVTVDTDKETLVVHDGSTAGGHPVAAEDMANVSSASIAGRLANDSIATSKLAAGSLPSDVTVASANLVDGTIVNADVNASAAIAGTKISPDFGSQNITTTGVLNCDNINASDNITITSTAPKIFLVDSDTNDDFSINGDGGTFRIKSETDSANRFVVNSDGHIDIPGNLDVGAGLDVTGDITATGNVSISNDLPYIDLVDTSNNSDFSLRNSNGTFSVYDTTNSSNRFTVASNGTASVNGNLDVSSGLDVTGDQTVSGKVKIGTTTTASTSADELVVEGTGIMGMTLRSDSTTGKSNIYFADGTSGTAQYTGGITYDHQHDRFRFNTNGGTLAVQINSDQTTNFSGGINVTGNITVSGTVDGRDVASDGSKLDGIESGATADQTASEIASLLDGQNLHTTGEIGRDAGDYIKFSNNTHADIYINSNNEFRFEADGDFHADGDVIAQSTTISSDRKLKENIEVIPNALDKVLALNGVSFDWKKTGEKSAGVIAQEVQGVLPEAVKEVTPLKGGDSHLSVNYHALTSILIESIKELKAEIEELKGGK